LTQDDQRTKQKKWNEMNFRKRQEKVRKDTLHKSDFFSLRFVVRHFENTVTHFIISLTFVKVKF
jgi:hypothetical protein